VYLDVRTCEHEVRTRVLRCPHRPVGLLWLSQAHRWSAIVTIQRALELSINWDVYDPNAG
jgi:hypothetical protein